jgi:hypothetical protein
MMAFAAATAEFDCGPVARRSYSRAHACAPAAIRLTGVHAVCPSMFKQTVQA